MDETRIALIVTQIIILIFSLAVHEAAHALVAHWRGDDTAKNLGRITLNPIPHIDPMWTIAIPAIMAISTISLVGTPFIFGGAKPVPVNPLRLKSPARDMALVAIAGPLSNVIQGIIWFIIGATLVVNGFQQGEFIHEVCYGAGYINLILALFNMIPIPPLDGSRVLGYFLPDKWKEHYMRMSTIGIVLLFVLLMGVPAAKNFFFHDIVNPFVYGVHSTIYNFVGAI